MSEVSTVLVLSSFLPNTRMDPTAFQLPSEHKDGPYSKATHGHAHL